VKIIKINKTKVTNSVKTQQQQGNICEMSDVNMEEEPMEESIDTSEIKQENEETTVENDGGHFETDNLPKRILLPAAMIKSEEKNDVDRQNFDADQILALWNDQERYIDHLEDKLNSLDGTETQENGKVRENDQHFHF
jgi:hypothetical protein